MHKLKGTTDSLIFFSSHNLDICLSIVIFKSIHDIDHQILKYNDINHQTYKRE